MKLEGRSYIGRTYDLMERLASQNRADMTAGKFTRKMGLGNWFEMNRTYSVDPNNTSDKYCWVAEPDLAPVILKN